MKREFSTSPLRVVVPAKAGIQSGKATAVGLDPGFRGGDDNLL